MFESVKERADAVDANDGLGHMPTSMKPMAQLQDATKGRVPHEILLAADGQVPYETLLSLTGHLPVVQAEKVANRLARPCADGSGMTQTPPTQVNNGNIGMPSTSVNLNVTNRNQSSTKNNQGQVSYETLLSLTSHLPQAEAVQVASSLKTYQEVHGELPVPLLTAQWLTVTSKVKIQQLLGNTPSVADVYNHLQVLGLDYRSGEGKNIFTEWKINKTLSLLPTFARLLKPIRYFESEEDRNNRLNEIEELIRGEQVRVHKIEKKQAEQRAKDAEAGGGGGGGGGGGAAAATAKTTQRQVAAAALVAAPTINQAADANTSDNPSQIIATALPTYQHSLGIPASTSTTNQRSSGSRISASGDNVIASTGFPAGGESDRDAEAPTSTLTPAAGESGPDTKIAAFMGVPDDGAPVQDIEMPASTETSGGGESGQDAEAPASTPISAGRESGPDTKIAAFMGVPDDGAPVQDIEMPASTETSGGGESGQDAEAPASTLTPAVGESGPDTKVVPSIGVPDDGAPVQDIEMPASTETSGGGESGQDAEAPASTPISAGRESGRDTEIPASTGVLVDGESASCEKPAAGSQGKEGITLPDQGMNTDDESANEFFDCMDQDDISAELQTTKVTLGDSDGDGDEDGDRTADTFNISDAATITPEKDGIIKSVVGLQDRIDELVATVEKQTNEIKELEKSLKTKEMIIAAQNMEIAEREMRSAELIQKVDEINEESLAACKDDQLVSIIASIKKMAASIKGNSSIGKGKQSRENEDGITIPSLLSSDASDSETVSCKDISLDKDADDDDDGVVAKTNYAEASHSTMTRRRDVEEDVVDERVTKKAKIDICNSNTAEKSMEGREEGAFQEKAIIERRHREASLQYTVEKFEERLDLVAEEIGGGIDEIEDSHEIRTGNGKLNSGDVNPGCGDLQEMAQYGRFKPEAAHCLLNHLLESDEIDLLVDVGSGIGAFLLQATVCFGINSRGVELIKERHKMAEKLREGMMKQNEELSFALKNLVQLQCGDFTHALQGELNPDSTNHLKSFLLGRDIEESLGRSPNIVLFANNAHGVFSETVGKPGCRSLDDYLATLFSIAPDGTRLVTFSEVDHHFGGVTGGTASELWFEKEELTTAEDAVTWSDSPRTLFIYTKRKSKWCCAASNCNKENPIVQNQMPVTSCLECSMRLRNLRPRTATKK